MISMVQKRSVGVLVVAGIVFITTAGVLSGVSGWTSTTSTTTITTTAAPRRRMTVPTSKRRSSFLSNNSHDSLLGGGYPRQPQTTTIVRPGTAATLCSSSLSLSLSSSSSASDDGGSISTIDLSCGGTKNETPEQHERVGQELAESIQRWLDSEWFPQDIHLQMGLRAKQSYVECRTSNPPQHDVMDILMKISLDLSEEWEEKYDAEAFINPYDVGNYAADWLTKTLTDVEGCECTSELF